MRASAPMTTVTSSWGVAVSLSLHWSFQNRNFMMRSHQTFSPYMNKTETHRHLHVQNSIDFNSRPNHHFSNCPVRHFTDQLGAFNRSKANANAPTSGGYSIFATVACNPASAAISKPVSEPVSDSAALQRDDNCRHAPASSCGVSQQLRIQTDRASLQQHRPAFERLAAG